MATYEKNGGVFDTQVNDIENFGDAMWYAVNGFDNVGVFTYNGHEHKVYAVGEMKLTLTYGDNEETIRTGYDLRTSGVWEYLSLEPSDKNFVNFIEYSPVPTVSVYWDNNNWFEVLHDDEDDYSEPCHTLDDVFAVCVAWQSGEEA